MGRLSESAINALLDAFLGSSHVAPFTASVDVALSLTQPANDGTNVSEPVGGSYAAAVVPNDNAHWNTAAGRQKTNKLEIEFPQPTGNWGAPGWFAIYDHGVAHTPATCRAWGALQTPKHIDATSAPPAFPAGLLVVNAPGT